MRKLLFIIAVLLSFGAQSQTFTPIHNYQAPDGIDVAKFFGIPHGPTPTLNGINRPGGHPLFYNTTDSSMYVYSGTQWLIVGGGIGGTCDTCISTISISEDSTELIFLRVNGDTAKTVDFFGSGGGGSITPDTMYTKSPNYWDNDTLKLKLGTGLSIDEDGALNATGGTGGVTQQQLDDSTAAIRDDKQDNITLTTDGFGLATLTGPVLNIPNNSSTVTSFQWSVLDSVSTPIADSLVSVGDKYLVGTSPTGAFASNANDIAVNTGTGTYTFSTASVGDILYNAKSAFVNKWDGSNWERIGRSANIHQFGDSYGQPVQIGSNDNDTMYLRVKNRNAVSVNALSSSYPWNRLTVYSNHGGSANAYIGFDQSSGGAKLSLYQYGSETYLRASGQLGIRTNNYLDVRTNVTGGKAFNINNVASGLGDIFYIDYRGNTTASSINVTSTTTPSIPNPVMTQTQINAITGRVVTFTFTAGSGYTNGTYTNDPALGGSGTGAIVNTTVSGGIVTACTLANGTLYKVGDVLTVSTDSIGTGSGYAITVTAISNSVGNTVFNSTRKQPAFYNGTDWVYPAQYGTATLASGTITVSDTRVKTGARIFVSCNTPSGTQGFLSAPVGDIIDETSFVINSTSATDNSTVNYTIINP